MRTTPRRFLVFVLSLGLSGGVVTAQRAPTAPAPAGGGGATTTGGAVGGGRQPGALPGTQPGIGQQGQQQGQQPTFEQRPIFLSGRVMLEDGTPPPEPVTIERICNGTPRPQAYTDSKGRFSFQLGDRNNVFMDASVSNMGSQGLGGGNSSGGMSSRGLGNGTGGGNMGGPGMVSLTGCDLRASLPGFRSEAIPLGQRSTFDNPDVGVIILHRLANVQGTAISFTTLAAPKDAKKAYEKAQKLLHDKNPKPAEAVKELEKAVEGYPQFAAAWYMLGETKLGLKDEDGARKAFEQSLAADAKYVNPYLQLATLDLRASRWSDAADITSRLAQLNPYIGQAHYFNALANYNLGKMDLAEKSARSALGSDASSRLPNVHHLLGAILAQRGNFPSAAEEYRSFLKLSPDSSNADDIRKKLTEWEGLGVIPRAVTAQKESTP